ncbi:FeoB-associated Cys-rich membrane protein [Streptococcus sp. CP1998]|uniref:FeoB-associated Cys-rich membrane protein n=1 Tax=Streptococcus sp. CP1998 TaxID=3238303 RepID=A0AB39L9C6_9STRE
MSTILITVLIFLAGLGLRSYLKGKGSCGDCECSCPIKDEMHQLHRH